MKTAISVPDEIHARAERAAKKHGMNRSQFYTAAAERFADELESADLTAAINEAVEAVEDESQKFAVEAGRVLLAADDERW